MTDRKSSKITAILLPQSNVGKFTFFAYVIGMIALPLQKGAISPTWAGFAGYIIDALSNIVPILLLLWLVRTILFYAKIIKPPTSTHSYFGPLLLTAFFCLMFFPIAVPMIFGQKAKTGAIDGVDALTSEEKNRYRTILSSVLQSEEAFTNENFKEFWILMRKMGVTNQAKADEVKTLMTGASGKYMQYLWEDAREALRTGRPFKSLQRENYEKNLNRLGVLSDFRIKENEDFIKKVSAKEKIQIRGQAVVFNEDLIKEALENIANVTSRVDKLFTPPSVGSEE